MGVGDVNRKCVPDNSDVLLQEALSFYEDFSKGSPETSDHIHVTFISVLINRIVVFCY